MNDKALIKRCQRGDRDAFDELIRLYYDYLSGSLLKVTADELLSEDLTQETFLKMIGNTTAAIRVITSAASGAIQTALDPKSMGMQKIVSALTAMPRLTAMALAVPVRLVEKKYAV